MSAKCESQSAAGAQGDSAVPRETTSLTAPERPSGLGLQPGLAEGPVGPLGWERVPYMHPVAWHPPALRVWGRWGR